MPLPTSRHGGLARAPVPRDGPRIDLERWVVFPAHELTAQWLVNGEDRGVARGALALEGDAVFLELGPHFGRGPAIDRVPEPLLHLGFRG